MREISGNIILRRDKRYSEAKQFERLSDSEKHEFFMACNLYYFCRKAPIIIDGKPMDFVRHPYERGILEDISPDQTWQKSAQMGASLMAELKSLHSANYILPHGVLYLIPTKTDVIDFSKKKMRKLIDENDIIRSWIHDETDSSGLKKVGNSYILFRGMQSSVGLKVQDVDMLVYDEIEEATESAISLAEKRVDHSEYKWKLRLSVPSDNDVGINSYFMQSDQRYWLIKCKGCGFDVCMEDEFPNCLMEITRDEVKRICPKCHTEIFPGDGRWVAKVSEARTRGYQISQLWSTFVDPAQILQEYRTCKNMGGFYNNTLGLPYTDVSARLTKEQVLSLVGNELMVERDPGPCMMGVDPGNVHHVVIGKRISDRKIKIIRLGIVHDAKNEAGETLLAWDILKRIIIRYNVSCCVIDGKPVLDEGRKLARELPGKIYLYFDSESQRGISIWRDRDWTVNINACEAMDASHRILKEKYVELPRRSSLVETFAKHCHSVGRKLEEDEETGGRRYYWKKLGQNHFRMAFNLMVLAMERTGVVRKNIYKSITQFRTATMEGYGG